MRRPLSISDNTLFRRIWSIMWRRLRRERPPRRSTWRRSLRTQRTTRRWMRKQTNRICCLLPVDFCSVSPSNMNQTTKIESLNHDKCILCQIPHSEISYLVFRYTFLFHHLESVPVVLLHRPEWKNPLQVRDVSPSPAPHAIPLRHTCSKHQRQIAKCIKQARQACIIPFLPDLDGTNNVEDQVEQKQ